VHISVQDLLVAAAIVVLVIAFFVVRRQSAQPVIRASAVLTPGALNPDVTQATIRSTICVHGWTKTVRPPVDYTNNLKLKQMRDYGETGPPSHYQEDHLISLELGGAPNDPRNLWPEPYPRASAVDRIENELNAKVCSGAMSLAEAQRKEWELKHRDG
jgi:hypothetical protein